tara:strand:+ start:3070 stop:3402 length:333 start_codon:yes stop_codon:yes gene_type:complete
MEIKKLKDMKQGWFVGAFEPTAFRTENFEVCYRTHPKGETWGHHFHEKITEINLLVSGSMILQGTRLNSGDIFTLYPYEIADPVFLEDCSIVCVKTPSIPDDKKEIIYKD